ncbi:SRPBCC domain-containing protein [Bacillus sp. NEB1478]|uniref:SRPBCC domain-containing protein n=1 Tax=Bacillus sp. NEB1478 TaxID=3073816 RepID=UPI002873D8A7|nr:SRPBCC domain-containing protein [Bacillus sp. NEB1478]WNB90996.1 SRPBCC domain-containing protein [Bacillus sp. NEB1478]
MAENHVKNSMTTTVEGTDIIFTRIFDAPRELVFQALSDPEHLSQWWGPKYWTIPVSKMDFREGGSWHYCMESPDGEMKSWGLALYKEIVEPERIFYEDYFSDEEGKINENLPGTLITLTLIEHEGKTKLVNHAQFSSEEAVKTVLDMGMVQGFTEMWDKFEAYLSKMN